MGKESGDMLSIEKKSRFAEWVQADSWSYILPLVENQDNSRDIAALWKKINKYRKSDGVALSTESGKKIKKLHRDTQFFCEQKESYIQCPQKNAYDSYYWELTKSLVNDEVKRIPVGSNMQLLVGKINQFSQEYLSIIVDMATRIYSKDLLQIGETANKLYQGNAQQINFFIKQKSLELLLAMMHSFREKQVLAMVVGNYQDQEYLLGSLAAKQGHGRRVLKHKSGNSRSSVPSFEMLSGDLTEQGIAYMGKTPEQKFAEITRLFAVPREWLPVPDGVFDLSVVSKALMAGIHWGIRDNLTEVDMAVFNVKAQLGRVIKDRLHFPVVVACNNPKAQRAALDSIHGLYLRRFAELGLLILLIKESAALPVAHDILEKLAGGT